MFAVSSFIIPNFIFIFAEIHEHFSSTYQKTLKIRMNSSALTFHADTHAKNKKIKIKWKKIINFKNIKILFLQFLACSALFLIISLSISCLHFLYSLYFIFSLHVISLSLDFIRSYFQQFLSFIFNVEALLM